MSTRSYLIQAAERFARWSALTLALVVAQIVSGIVAHALFAGTLSESRRGGDICPRSSSMTMVRYTPKYVGFVAGYPVRSRPRTFH